MPLQDLSIALPERYRVLRRIASGGMATVYEAEDGMLGRRVAVKVLAPHVAADPTSRQRFEREARTAARVSDHPNVATIYDIGEHDRNAFIVMELFPGGTVADRLRESSSIPRPQALAWLQQAAEALDHAHGRDLIHRDVKPANLLLDDRDRLAVADFGIARLIDDSSLTQAGQVLGTAAYLSPEQALGRSATAASDRYALAVVAFELLTGRRPFAAEHAAAQARQHVEAPMPDTGISAEVDDVLCRAMAKEPGDRYPTAARFVEELRHAVGRPSAEAAERTAPTRPARAAAAAAPAPTSRRMAPIPDARDDRPPAPTRSGGGRRGWLALTALALLVLAVAAIALIGGSGGSSEGTRAEREAQRSEPQQERQRDDASEEPDAPAAPGTSDDGQPTPSEAPDNEPESGPGPVTSGNESPAELNDRGYARLQAGDAAGAVPLLERAVAGFDAQGDAADSTTFGYALYNLGQAYEQTGRPEDAVRMYERRLQVSPNDRPGIVRQALRRAKRAAGQGD